MTILVVEDNLKLAANLQSLLELEGHAVAVAHDGEEGPRRALAERFDCIILDLNLPKLDGIAVSTSATRQQPNSAAMTAAAAVPSVPPACI